MEDVLKMSSLKESYVKKKKESYVPKYLLEILKKRILIICQRHTQKDISVTTCF
jgi:hypothetical protein